MCVRGFIKFIIIVEYMLEITEDYLSKYSDQGFNREEGVSSLHPLFNREEGGLQSPPPFQPGGGG